MKKMGSLNKKSMVSLVVLGLVILLGTGLAGGIQLYRQNMKMFRNAADSYVSMLYYEIGDIDLDLLIKEQDAVADYYGQLHNFYTAKTLKQEELDAYLDTVGENTKTLGEKWGRFSDFIMGFGNICPDIRYAYVVIPTEEDLIYVWDSDLEEDVGPFTHDAYTMVEKEHLFSVYNGEVEKDFFVDPVNGELLGTSICAIRDFDGKICAVAGVDISISDIRYAFIKLLFHIGLAVVLIMLVSITVYHHVIRKRIISPIMTLTSAADSLVTNLREGVSEAFQVDIRTNDEIEVLAHSFEEMDLKLKDYIRENDVITAERERIVTELSLAARIQEDMLPRIFPPFPNRPEIDLYAVMKPAKEVGGDFYDYFLIDEDHLALVMADVSGKGIPAALFMMMSKIMLQNFALTKRSPGEVLAIVNNQICLNTQEEMFVTVWLGVLELSSGVLTAANAGHEYPVIKRSGEDFKLIKDPHGLVLGGMEGIHYREYHLQLEPGTRLFLYTDGLPESTDSDKEMYGTERMLQALNEVKSESPKVVLEHMIQSALAFSGEAPQFDDTTMLCLDYYGSE